MKKIIIIILCLCVIYNSSFAYVERDVTVKREKTIPFSFSSDNSELLEDISIKGLSNVNIKDIYVDNGNVDFNIDGNYIELNFSGGKKSSGNKTVSKTGSFNISDIKVDDKIFSVNIDENIKGILEVSGDISYAKVKNNGEVEVKLKDEAVGLSGYDKDSIVNSSFLVSIKEDNKERKIISDEFVLEHDIVGNITPVNGDTSSVEAISVNKNKVKITFNNGIPIANENIVNSNHTYCWVDRDENGFFKEYRPNSIYSTDINKITGLGEYLDINDFDEIGMKVTNDLWEDYCGVEINGKRYVYIYDKSKGIPKELESDLIKLDYITVEDQNFNSEKYTVKFQNTDVSYIPEGKLYSMGELVENTLGWGEVYPNNENESKKTFFNELTGKLETYVKHFKFFYGPEEKRSFGGYFTYPYSCEFKYNHYKPINYYNGEIVYLYEDVVRAAGYVYNGFVKIEYDEKMEVYDYPPTAPYNIKYNKNTGLLSWGTGSDDYTESKNLIYEIETYLNGWNTYKKTDKGVLKEECPKNYQNNEIRIRTVDEVGQCSDWAYVSDSGIELIGSISPYIVSPGDKVDIEACVKSFSKVQSVIAKNSEMQMYTELQKIDEKSPNFFEMSFNLEGVFPDEGDDYIIVNDSANALGNKEEFETINFRTKDKFDGMTVSVESVEDIKLKENGTIIFSNQNYLNPPKNMFRYDNKSWFLSWGSEISYTNKVTNKIESFFLVESYAKYTKSGNKYIYVPTTRIKVNKFQYDESGQPTFYEIEISKSVADKPFIISWNTDVSGITEIKIYFEKELVYNYKAEYKDINKYVDNFYSVEMNKRMKKYSQSTYGYILPSKGESATWSEMVCNIAVNRDIRDLLWLGYKVYDNEYLKEEYVEEYNNNPKVRNNYRLFITDEVLSEVSRNKYISILKNTNIPITKEKNTVFGDDVLQYTSVFHGKNILIPEDAKEGKYQILLTAYDIDGNFETTYLTLIVQTEEKIEENTPSEENDKEEEVKLPTVTDFNVGRFFYEDGNGYLEELSKPIKRKDSNGFICAGETLGVVFKAKDIEYIEFDFVGDKSIKTFDELTRKFLIENPQKAGKSVGSVEKEYNNFPIKIYPQYVDKSKNSVFTYFYILPYKTKQSLESWSTLKEGTIENIDKSKLFDRKNLPYSLVAYLNGDKNNFIKFDFDVFERWDTILNRDVRSYISNLNTKWKMEIEK